MKPASSTRGAIEVAEVLDKSRLELIHELDPDGSDGLLARMIDAFSDHVPRQVSGILEAASEGDCDAVAGLAHSLKSAAINLGAMSLHERATRLEIAGRDKDRDAMSDDLKGLEAEVHVVLRTLRSLA